MQSIQKAGPRVRHWELGVLIVLMAIGFALRWGGIRLEPLWLDELYSMELSAGRGYVHDTLPVNEILVDAPDLTHLTNAAPWWRIWNHQGRDTHPPIYFVLLRGWRSAFGTGDVAARSLSVVVSTISIALIFQLARMLWGNSAGLWAAAIMALAPTQIYFGHEARPYALATTLTLATAIALLRLERLGWSWRRGIALGAGLVAMLLTHYFTAGVAIAMAIYALLRFRGADRRRVAGMFFLAAIFWLVTFGPIFLEQMKFVRGNLGSLIEDPPGHARLVLLRAARTPLWLIADIPRSSLPLAPVAGVIYLLPILLLRKNRALLLPALWLWCGIGMVAIMDLARCSALLNFVRYPLIGAPGVYLVLAGLLADRGNGDQRSPAKYNSMLAHLLPACAVIYCVIALPTLNEKNKEDWREIAQAIGRPGKGKTLAVLASTNSTDWENAATMLYLGTSHYRDQKTTNIDYLLLDHPADEDLMRQVRGYGQIFLLSAWAKPGEQSILPGLDAAESMRLPHIGVLNRMRVK